MSYEMTFANEKRHSTTSEESLIADAVAGDHEAFSELVNRHKDKLFAAMLRVARSADLAEEIVQDAFVQAYLKLSAFRRHAAFSTWLFRIAFNKYLGLKRADRGTTSLDSLDKQSSLQPIDGHDSAERVCLRIEERQRVHKALARLDKKSRSILVLREMNGLSYEEISDVLQLKLGTVRSQLSRARGKLHRELHADVLDED